MSQPKPTPVPIAGSSRSSQGRGDFLRHRGYDFFLDGCDEPAGIELLDGNIWVFCPAKDESYSATELNVIIGHLDWLKRCTDES